MNIIYLLTNSSKQSGKRFYIGSKQECQIADVDGVTTIVDREGKPYYSSSQSFEFKQDMLNGDIFVASVLEQVLDRNTLLQEENKHITLANAVESEEYYNISNAVLNCHNQDALANLFGETVKDLAKNNSSISKRDNSAKELGFNNFGELCFSIWERYQLNQNWQMVSSSFNKERHWSKVVIKDFNMEKAKDDLTKVSEEQIRWHIARKCSLAKACELLGIELPAGRILLGDFNKESQRAYSVALLLGKTQGELEAEVTKDFLKDLPVIDICKKYGINETSAKRYFMRCIRRHLDPEDISSEILETQEEILEAKKKRQNKQTRIIQFKEKLKTMDNLVRTEGRQSNNKSGVEGIFKSTKGKLTYWTAQWVDRNGKKRSKSFSVSAYGDEEAFEMAVNHRNEMTN